MSEDNEKDLVEAWEKGVAREAKKIDEQQAQRKQEAVGVKADRERKAAEQQECHAQYHEHRDDFGTFSHLVHIEAPLGSRLEPRGVLVKRTQIYLLCQKCQMKIFFGHPDFSALMHRHYISHEIRGSFLERDDTPMTAEEMVDSY